MAGPSGRTPIGNYPYSTPDDTVDVPRDVEALAFAIDPNASAIIIGEVRSFGLATPPARWLSCDGAAVEQSDYPELFEALGSRFNTGGESSTQFRVPAIAGRAIVGAGAGTDLTNRPIGSTWGSENHKLNTSQIPSHSHTGITGDDSPDHLHNVAGGTATDYPDHAHGGSTDWQDPIAAQGIQVAACNNMPIFTATGQSGSTAHPGPKSNAGNWWNVTAGHAHNFTTVGANARHTHSFNVNSAGANTRHKHSIPAEGGGGDHPNTQPSIALLVCIYAGR